MSKVVVQLIFSDFFHRAMRNLKVSNVKDFQVGIVLGEKGKKSQGRGERGVEMFGWGLDSLKEITNKIKVSFPGLWCNFACTPDDRWVHNCKYESMFKQRMSHFVRQSVRP